jgi:hypothetical protein
MEYEVVWAPPKEVVSGKPLARADPHAQPQAVVATAARRDDALVTRDRFSVRFQSVFFAVAGLALAVVPVAALFSSKSWVKSWSSDLFRIDASLLGLVAFIALLLVALAISSRTKVARGSYAILFVGAWVSFIMSFATIYFQDAVREKSSFSPPVLTRLDAVYFAATNFTALGSRFVPNSQGLQGLVLVQVVVGFGVAAVLIVWGLNQLMDLPRFTRAYQLGRYVELRDSGDLSADEFESQKTKLLPTGKLSD